MNVLPIDRARVTAPLADRAGAAEPASREDIVRQTAALARTLADVLLANVQNTTSLNLSAARALLAHARIPAPASAERHSETWRSTWRSFEVCATSADQMLNLTRGHLERSTAALWRTTERLLEDLAQTQAARVNELLASFDALRVAQEAYWHAAQQAHSDLVALAQAPVCPADAGRDHGAH